MKFQTTLSDRQIVSVTHMFNLTYRAAMLLPRPYTPRVGESIQKGKIRNLWKLLLRKQDKLAIIKENKVS